MKQLQKNMGVVFFLLAAGLIVYSCLLFGEAIIHFTGESKVPPLAFDDSVLSGFISLLLGLTFLFAGLLSGLIGKGIYQKKPKQAVVEEDPAGPDLS